MHKVTSIPAFIATIVKKTTSAVTNRPFFQSPTLSSVQSSLNKPTTSLAKTPASAEEHQALCDALERDQVIKSTQSVY